MSWQEYQDAVGELYSQMDGVGTVFKNITLPDKITGHPRQIDVWLELESKGHKLGVLIDAKYRKEKIDIKDVEEVLSLGQAVGANKCVLVALNGWTDPAVVKAEVVGLDLRLVTLEEALDLIVPDKWFICPGCNKDCIVLEGGYGMAVEGMWSLLTAGRCRECLLACVLCWACGDQMIIDLKGKNKCDCGHSWKNTTEAIYVKVAGSRTWEDVLTSVLVIDPEVTDIHIIDGIEQKRCGNYDQAVVEFTKAVEKMPVSAIPYYQRALIYDELGHIDEAIADYSKAIENDPEYAMAYGSRGIAQYTSGRLSEAVADLEYYLLLSPESSSRTAIENTIQHANSRIARQQN